MARILVRDLMTEKPYTLPPEASLEAVYDLMEERRVRHVPVVDDRGRLRGLVSHRDLIRAALHGDRELPISTLRAMLQEFNVEEIMVAEPETIDAEEVATSAGMSMLENKFGCMLVVDGEELVGILTESDFVRYVVETSVDSGRA